MTRHPLFTWLVLILALVAGKPAHVATYGIAGDHALISLASASQERSWSVTAGDVRDDTAILAASDDGADGLLILFDAEADVFDSLAPVHPGSPRLAPQSAPPYWPTAPPREI